MVDTSGAGRGIHLKVLTAVAPSLLSDNDLCRAFLKGDDQSFNELIRRHQERVYALVRRYTFQADDASDLCQRSFLKAFQAARRALPRLGDHQPVPFQAWLFRIAVNLGKNHARQERRWRRAPVAAIDTERRLGPTALEALERAEGARWARAAVLELPRRQREVLTLRIDAELSFAEIADVLGITENNAKVHFHYALKRLKAILADGDKKETS